MTSTCTATKRDGTPCTLPNHGSNGLCWAHNPENQEKRRRGQSRGGKAKLSWELLAINARLKELAEQVIAKEVDRGDAAVAGQLFNYVLRGISVSLKAREQEELIERLEALEESIERQDRSRGYGA